MRKAILAAIALLNVAACSYQETTQAYSAPMIGTDGSDVSGSGIYIAPWRSTSGVVARSGLSSQPDDPNGTGSYFATR